MNSQSIKGTILLIEDEPGFRHIYSLVLKNAGYDVLEAVDGDAGLKMVLANKPTLVLLDLMLPKLHGFDVLKKIRETESVKEIPVIIFSVMGEQMDIERGMILGANDYTIKGFYTPKEILGKIEAVLSSVDIKKDLNSYFLSIEDGRGDSTKLQHAIGLTKMFNCPQCDKQIVLEMLPDYTRTNGHWFSSHFYCRFCHKDF